MKTEDTVRMANQIADFFAAYPRDEAISGVAGHIKSFWEARMLTALYAHRDSGGAGFHPLVVAAIDQVLRPASVPQDQ